MSDCSVVSCFGFFGAWSVGLSAIWVLGLVLASGEVSFWGEKREQESRLPKIQLGLRRSREFLNPIPVRA